ncbi:MAG: amidohydrolase [Clostridiales bacterium]|nr:amidohydrolase [Clostridiales bacterium]
MYKIIDIHTHIYPEKIAEKACSALGKFYDFPIQGKATYRDIKAQSLGFEKAISAEDLSNSALIAGFVLLNAATSPHQVQKVNDALAKNVLRAREDGFFCRGFAGMHQDYEDMKGEVERCEAIGLTGFKLHPDIQGCDIDDSRFLPLYEACEGRMPVFFHMGDDRADYQYSTPEKLRRILDMFPRLKAVAAHFGCYKTWAAGAECLWDDPNVYFDCSSALWALSPDAAVALIRRISPGRMLYGTDYPVFSFLPYYRLFAKLELTDGEKEDILYNNAIRFFEMCDAENAAYHSRGENKPI